MKGFITLLMVVVLGAIGVPGVYGDLSNPYILDSYDHTIWVDKNSQSPTEDGTQAHPYKALNTALFYTQPNTIIKILPGVYQEELNFKVGCNNLLLDGAGITSVTLRGISRQLPVFVLDLMNIENIWIRNCTIAGGSYGVGFGYSSGGLDGCLVIGNRLYNVGIHFAGMEDPPSTDTICAIINNTTIDGDSVYGNTKNGLHGTNYEIRNSIVVNHTEFGIEGDWSCRIVYNNIWNNNVNLQWAPDPDDPEHPPLVGVAIGNISEDPLFRNRLGLNYELLDGSLPSSSLGGSGSRSPCIDAGTTDGIHPDFMTDMGCYNKYGRTEETTLVISPWQRYE